MFYPSLGLGSTGGSGGDLVGPASSTDNALVRFDLATGKLVQNSLATVDDSGRGVFPLRVTASGTNGNYPTVVAGDPSGNYIELTADASAGYLGTTSNLTPIVVRGSRTEISSGKVILVSADASHTMLKSNGTTTQDRLGDDSGFAFGQAKLTTDTAATTGLVAGALAALTTASLTLYDSTGQAYVIPCKIP